MGEPGDIAAAFASQRADLWTAAKQLKRQLYDCAPEQALAQLLGLLPGEGLPALALLALFKLHRSKLKAKELGDAAREEALRRAQRLLQQTCDELLEKERLLQHVLGELDRSQAELKAQREDQEEVRRELCRRLELADGTIARLEALVSAPVAPVEPARPATPGRESRGEELFEELLGGRARLEETQVELAELKRRLQRLTGFLGDCSAFFRRRGSRTFERLARTLTSLASGEGFPVAEVGEADAGAGEEEQFARLLRERLDRLEGLTGSLLREVETARQAVAEARQQYVKVEAPPPELADSENDEHKPSREERKVNLFKKFLQLNIRADD